MSEKKSEFDAFVKLHTEIKSFKIDKSVEILKKFHSGNQPKFKLTAEEKEEKFLFNIENKEDKEKLRRILTNLELPEKSTGDLRKIFKKYRDKQLHPKTDEAFLLSDNVIVTKREEKGWIITDHGKNNTFIVIESDKELNIYIKKPSRLNLSSTAVCAYALSQYFELWDEGKTPEYKNEFPNLDLFQMGAELEDALNNEEKSKLLDEFEKNGFLFLENVSIELEKDNKWTVTDDQRIFVVKKDEGKLNVYLHFELTNYYSFIIDGLGRYLVDSKPRNTSELELTDEFSLLNVLSLLKGIPCVFG